MLVKFALLLLLLLLPQYTSDFTLCKGFSKIFTKIQFMKGINSYNCVWC
jgi:hypothetical protein